MLLERTKTRQVHKTCVRSKLYFLYIYLPQQRAHRSPLYENCLSFKNPPSIEAPSNIAVTTVAKVRLSNPGITSSNIHYIGFKAHSNATSFPYFSHLKNSSEYSSRYFAEQILKLGKKLDIFQKILMDKFNVNKHLLVLRGDALSSH